MKKLITATLITAMSISVFAASDFGVTNMKVAHQECPVSKDLELLNGEPSKQCVYTSEVKSEEDSNFKVLTAVTMSDADTYNFRIYGADCKDGSFGYGETVNISKSTLEHSTPKSMEEKIVKTTNGTFGFHTVSPGTRESAIYGKLCGAK